MDAADHITQLLLDWGRGNEQAQQQLLAIVYSELHRIAASHLRAESASQALQPTALVHEVYLRLVDQTRIRWKNRSQFFAISSQLIRRVLVDHARKRRALKRGGDLTHLSFEETLDSGNSTDQEILLINEALSALEELDPRQARVVELRFFGGMNVKEVAEILSISPVTVKRDWKTARAFLFHYLSKAGEGPR